MNQNPKKVLDKRKPVFSESTIDTEIAFVIDNTNRIEYELKQIIANYVAKDPEKIEFARNILLHNSIINLGAKFRLLQYIVEKEKIPKINDANCFYRFVELRNAFAHSDTVTQHIEIGDISSHDGGTVVVEDYYLLESLSSSGKPKNLKRKEALEEFKQCLMTIQNYLNEVVHQELDR